MFGNTKIAIISESAKESGKIFKKKITVVQAGGESAQQHGVPEELTRFAGTLVLHMGGAQKS